MGSKLLDIQTREDIKRFLSRFYDKAQKDDVLVEKFSNLDMAQHIEVITDFWDSILFGSNRYLGDPFGKHVPMQLKEIHFNRWVMLFTETADELFVGDVVSEMKHRATTIAQVFKYKLTS